MHLVAVWCLVMMALGIDTLIKISSAEPDQSANLFTIHLLKTFVLVLIYSIYATPNFKTYIVQILFTIVTQILLFAILYA